MNKAVDIAGREINVGDILAVGQRSGNSGTLDIRVVKCYKTMKTSSRKIYIKVGTTVGGWLTDLRKTLIIPFSLVEGTELESKIKDELSKVSHLVEIGRQTPLRTEHPEKCGGSTPSDGTRK